MRTTVNLDRPFTGAFELQQHDTLKLAKAESTTFPELASEGSLRAFRHGGLWLTVNTPKELRAAQAHVEAHPEWLS